MASGQTESEESPFGSEGQRVVLLITNPLDESVLAIAKATGVKASPSPPIDWSSCENIALPNLSSRLKFTTHYALCVIACEVWESTSMNLLEKFRQARFWDHPGDSTWMAPSSSSQSSSSTVPPDKNACQTWSDGKIRRIESGEVIGRTDRSDEEITRDYTELRQNWTYMPLFWNCHDLAIRLACIIVQPSIDVIGVLKELIISLRHAFYEEMGWDLKTGNICIAGWGAAAIGGLASVPPLVIAGGSLFLAGCFIGGYVRFSRSAKEAARCKFMTELEEKFPQLWPLHN